MAEYAIAKGHRVIGIDQSDELLARAKMRFPSAQWINATLEEYAFADQCQGVICWDSLFHVERSHHECILTRIATSLPIGGRLMLTVGGSEHPAFTDVMFDKEFLYDSLPPAEVLRILVSLGCVTLVSEFMNLPTTGRDKGRYAIVAEKAG
jgi:2-polyprenyl-3-methyl-5-hydroxy-6-metoxy-1,4-benzoquinol methylase